MKKGIPILIYPMLLAGLFLVTAGGCRKKDNSNTDPVTGTVTDVDGNVYKTVRIGTQWWMAENLKTTRYSDGVPVPLITDSAIWRLSSTPAYCWQGNNISHKDGYGALYNWYAVSIGKLAPAGWHIPSDAEWTVLTDFLGGESVAGGKMKSTGTIEAATGIWYAPNTGASNASGFTAVPGSDREYGHFFLSLLGINGHWWSSTFTGIGNAWARDLDNMSVTADRANYAANFGFSVRCVKD